MVQIKTITATRSDKLDSRVNEFLSGIKASLVKDVRLTTPYDQDNYTSDYIAMIIYVAAPEPVAE